VIRVAAGCGRWRFDEIAGGDATLAHDEDGDGCLCGVATPMYASTMAFRFACNGLDVIIEYALMIETQ
jgi:hypothetical protein